jgi:hypothetical protein
MPLILTEIGPCTCHVTLLAQKPENTPPLIVGISKCRGIFLDFWAKKVTCRAHCKDSSPMIQYCPLLALLNQTSQEVTHPGIALAEARLTAEF